MRIKTRIAAGGGRSLTRLPLPAAELNECLQKPDERGKQRIDLAKAAAAFADNDRRHFTPSSRDDESVYFAAFTILENLHSAYNKVCADPDSDCHENEQCRADEIVSRKVDRDRVVFARIDLNRTAHGVRAVLAIDNPFHIVGAAELEARAYLAAVAQIILHIQRECEWLEIATDIEGLIDEANARTAASEARAKYADCERRSGSGEYVMCSPSKFDCPFFKNGHCAYGEKEKEGNK